MHFSLSALASAVQIQLSASIAGRLALAASLTGLKDEASFDENGAGEILALAMVSDPHRQATEVDNLVLTSAEIISGERSVILTPAEAYQHPLLGRWAAASFDLALGSALRAGTQLTQAAPGAPVFLTADMVEIEDVIRSARFQMAFNDTGAQVSLNYGDAAAGPTATAGVVRRLSGDALVAIGDVVRIFASTKEPPARPSADAAEETRH